MKTAGGPSPPPWRLQRSRGLFGAGHGANPDGSSGVPTLGERGVPFVIAHEGPDQVVRVMPRTATDPLVEFVESCYDR